MTHPTSRDSAVGVCAVGTSHFERMLLGVRARGTSHFERFCCWGVRAWHIPLREIVFVSYVVPVSIVELMPFSCCSGRVAVRRSCRVAVNALLLRYLLMLHGPCCARGAHAALLVLLRPCRGSPLMPCCCKCLTVKILARVARSLLRSGRSCRAARVAQAVSRFATHAVLL